MTTCAPAYVAPAVDNGDAGGYCSLCRVMAEDPTVAQSSQADIQAFHSRVSAVPHMHTKAWLQHTV